MRWSRRKKEKYDNFPELPTSLGELMEELDSCSRQIEEIAAEIAELTTQKFAGHLNDREYNLQTSYLAQRSESFKQRRDKLLRQLDITQRNIGRKALGG